MERDRVWLCGLNRPTWEVVGIFDTEAAAVACCRTQQHFVAEVAMNQDVGDQTLPFPVAWYPTWESKAEAKAQLATVR